ncbi:MAG: diguanylate cyclase, partial [Pseudomonadota bacterium]|nr:diguanylate cyclase [Pseudomonadota bacterium]
RHFANLEESAATGQYEEIWSLPSGQTYKVRGQPHPDGAIALLFEDITADISLTRRFRADLEMGQAVLDDLDEAVAVFSPAGILAMANKRYVALWNSDPSQSLTEIGIHDTIRLWQDNVDGTAPWMALRDMVLGHAPRQEMTATLDHISGVQITMRARPISGGAIIVGFRPALVDQVDMETLETAM